MAEIHLITKFKGGYRILFKEIQCESFASQAHFLLNHTHPRWSPERLDLSRAHTLHTASTSIWELQQQQHAWTVCIGWWPLPTYTRPDVCMSESTWPAVGTVDRYGQQKHPICDIYGPCHIIGSILKLVFHRFWQICRIAKDLAKLIHS